ncbi:major facilitator superfamily domain-containing protein [Delphinella strobiligena]|nr:major facilitator superfamily domain-containing protein [Delphinella strobiligena]
MLADDDRSSHSPVPLLFSDDNDDETTEMLPLESKTPIIREDISPPSASAPGPSAGALASRHETNPAAGPAPVYRVYKRRFFGLFQLVLLNIIVSWDWLTFSAVSTTASGYFDVSESDLNWLSTGFLFAFVLVAPLVIWTLNKAGPKGAIIVAAVLTLVGNWLRYAGTRVGSNGSFGVVVLGQVIIGFSQPFVLCAPTRYSDLWFSDKGRVSATALASLANPLGGALGQLIGPLWVTDRNSIPHMVLYTAIISSVASLPAFFIPTKPPTPPSASAAQEKLELLGSIRQLCCIRDFWLLFVPFSVYVGFFNASSSLLNQILEPYGFSEDEAGIAGGIMIIVGLIASAVVSPMIDRTKQYLITIRLLVPLIAVGYLILIFAPETRAIAAPYVICGLLGAASFSLLPCALEFLVEFTSPISPEVSSTFAWVGGQLLGAVFIIIMDALKGGWASQPEGNMERALISQAVVSWAVVPCVYILGRGRKGNIRLWKRSTLRPVEEDGV